MNKSCVCGMDVEKCSSEYLAKNHSLGTLIEKHPSKQSNELTEIEQSSPETLNNLVEIEKTSSEILDKLVDEAKRKFKGILEFSLSPATKKPHKFEKSLFQHLLELGGVLLMIYFHSLGFGDAGKSVATDDGRVLKRYRVRSRDYISIYGKVPIYRYYYWVSGKSGIFPLDKELNLPERAFSYYLQEILVRNGTDLTYEKSLDRLEQLFGINISPRSLMDVLEDVSRHSDEFRDNQPAPPVEKEGEILVVSVDGKGIPIRKDEPAEKKGEKNHKKKMCMVSAVYTIDKNVRTADDMLKKDGDYKPPKLCCKRVRGCLGDKDGKDEFIGKLQKEVKTRDFEGPRTRVFISDGEIFLRNMQEKYFPGYIAILDIFHVKEKLWDFSHCFHREGSGDAKDYVALLYRMLLEGNAFGCLQAMKATLNLKKLSKSKRETIKRIVVYFENNLDRMKYDEYLKKGLPIGSGAVESACKSLVKIRMEGCGMRWSKSGANAMLKLRAINLNGDINDYFDHHIKAEENRLYPQIKPLQWRINEMSKSSHPVKLKAA